MLCINLEDPLDGISINSVVKSIAVMLVLGAFFSCMLGVGE